MHDQNGNFSRKPETIRINANARKNNQQTTMTEMKNAFDGLN